MNQADLEASEKPPIVVRWLATKKSRRIMLAVLAGVILLAGTSWYWYSNQSVVDRQLVSEANFTVYAPKAAPAGYRVDDKRTVLRNGVLSYGFVDESSPAKNITVTVQAKPSGFDMVKMTGGGSVSSRAVDAGTLYDLSAGGSSQFLLDSGEGLIFITSADSIDNSTVNSLANSLVRLN